MEREPCSLVAPSLPRTGYNFIDIVDADRRLLAVCKRQDAVHVDIACC